MLAAGLGLMECPDALCKVGGLETGVDKLAWAAEKIGTTSSNVLIGLGVCKLLGLLDIYLLQIMPRFTLLCVAIMMIAVTYGHSQFEDGMYVVSFLLSSLVAAATWPAKPVANKKKA